MSQVTRDHILKALSGVMDPDLHRDIVSLGFIKELEIKDGEVSLVVELTTPACPMKDRLKQQAHDSVAAVPGVTSVTVRMTSRVRGSKNQERGGLLPGVRNVIAVASGKGGVGKSTIAVNLALALSLSGARVGILDADIYGPSLPRMLNLQGKPKGLEEDGSKMLHPLEAYGLKAMSMGIFMPEEAPMIWRGPMVGMAVEQLLRDVVWGDLDYLVVDLPPGTGDAQLTLTQKVPLTGVVIVSTPQDVALADVKKGINMFRQVNVPILGLIENMSYHICSECGHRSEIFSHGGARREAEAAGIPFLGEVPLDGVIREVSDAGTPVLISRADGPQAQIYRTIASTLAARIAVLNHQASRFPKIVVE